MYHHQCVSASCLGLGTSKSKLKFEITKKTNFRQNWIQEKKERLQKTLKQ